MNETMIQAHDGVLKFQSCGVKFLLHAHFLLQSVLQQCQKWQRELQRCRQCGCVNDVTVGLKQMLQANKK